MAAISREREQRRHWQQVRELIHQEADVDAVSWQLRLAIFEGRQASPVRALVAHMTTARTHFTFRVDTWTSEGESIVEHVAGVEDYEIAFSPPTVPPADANLAHPSPCGWVHEESRTADACEWCRGNGASPLVIAPSRVCGIDSAKPHISPSHPCLATDRRET